MKTLLKNCWVLTQDNERRLLRGYDVLVEGNRIAKVAKEIIEEADVKIDGKGKLLMPGLINTHTHLAMTLFRSYADDMVLKEWLEKKIWPLERKLRREDVYHGSRLGILEMIRSGITTFADMYFFPKETQRACEKMGMRANLSLTFFDFPMLDTSPDRILKGEKPEGSELVSYSIGPHAPYTVGEENLLRAREFAEKNDCRIHVHVAETRWEVYEIKKKMGKRPVQYLDAIGFLCSRVMAVHCVWLTKSEVKILADRGVKVVHCPISNSKLAGGGNAPIPEMMEAGITIALGTDGATSNNSLNMFENMKFATLMQKNSRWDPRICPAQSILDFATREGARVLGIDAGSVEEGKLADLILLNLESPNLRPVHEGGIPSLIVYAANPSNITHVMINGRLLMKDGKVIFDEDEILSKVQDIAEDVVRR